jgi:transcriptional regulator with XRE-family HTH domain
MDVTKDVADIPKLFAGNLKDILESQGMPQKALAEKCKITESTVSRYVAGKHRPDIGVVMKIAYALNVSIDYLCGLIESPLPVGFLGVEMQLLMRCYERADSHDKKIVWTILERYMSADEKERPISSSFAARETGRRG